MKRREAVNRAKRAIALAISEGLDVYRPQVCDDDQRVLQAHVKIAYYDYEVLVEEIIQLEIRIVEVMA